MWKKILNFILFQIVWFSCVIGAGKGYPAIGPVIFACVAGIHFTIISANRRRDFITVASVTAIGLVADTLTALSGAMSFGAYAILGPVAPPFMLVLWANFALLLNCSLSWLNKQYSIGAVLGVIGGPLAYYAGARFGAVQLHTNIWYALTIIALEWGLVIPLILYIVRQPDIVPSADGADHNAVDTNYH
jgi:hypothetical protein